MDAAIAQHVLPHPLSGCGRKLPDSESNEAFRFILWLVLIHSSIPHDKNNGLKNSMSAARQRRISVQATGTEATDLSQLKWARIEF